MFQRSLVFFLALLCLPSLVPSSARAFDGGNGLGMAYLFGYGSNNVGRMHSYVPSPPYFALHPPVYYGQRYTRPYGLSPFAAWPQLQPTAGYHGQPAVDRTMSIANPHYSPSSSKTPVAGSVAAAKPVTPLVIGNPYFRPETIQKMTKKSAEIH